MKKIFSLVAAVLFTASMMADAVVLPATLDVNNVSFRSEGMPDFTPPAESGFTGTYFDMGPNDSANDTLLYAEWDVTIQPLKYDLAVDVYNTNSWRVQVYLLNQAGDTLKSLRYKGSSGQCGNYAIGSIDMRDLTAGTYKLRAHAATAWSAMKLKDIIVKADYKGVKVNLPGELLPDYAELFGNASVTDNAIAFKPSTANTDYATWNVNFAKAGEYKVAIDITASNGHNYGVTLLSADGATEIGTINEGGQKSDTGEKELGALVVSAAGDYKVKLTNATQWSEAVLNKITFTAPTPRTLYLQPNEDWKKDGARFAICILSEPQVWVDMTGVEGNVGYYSAVVATSKQVIFCRMNGETTENKWENKWNQTQDMTLEDDKDMCVISGWDNAGAWAKYEPPYVPKYEDGFYLVGKFNNVDAWAPAADRMMTKNAEQTEFDEYKITIDLLEGDMLKVIYSDKDVYTWYPDGMDNNYVVGADYAGNGKTIYFRPDGLGGEGWHYGYIWIDKNEPTALENTNATVKAAKVIENGQLIIIKNGVRYNAQGAIMR